MGAAYYYSDTLRDTAKAKELLERAAQNGSEYAAVLLNRIAGHEHNAVATTPFFILNRHLINHKK